LKDISATKEKDLVHKCFYIGFIGYPNVGKSSVINVLMKKKRVAVAQMPGKTKHYQTLFLPEEVDGHQILNKDVCLMDCPGLVFPSFTHSKADMMVNGILPIDQLREWHSSIGIITQKLPRQILEEFYAVSLPDIYSATQFLQVLALKRGFYTGRNLPDEARMAKIVLKDYVCGRLLYCNLRPDYNETEHGVVVPFNLKNDMLMQINTKEEKEKQDLIKEIPANFDDNYEKINIFVDDSERKVNLKVTGNNDFDANFFNDMSNKEMITKENQEKVIDKNMRRALKFAMKRGDISEEGYEQCVTFEDFEKIILKCQRGNTKEIVGVKKISF